MDGRTDALSGFDPDCLQDSVFRAGACGLLSAIIEIPASRARSVRCEEEMRQWI